MSEEAHGYDRFRDIRCEVRDRILTITLNRPHRMNAATRLMCEELLAAFEAADADDEVRVVVLTGEGRAFCVGMDLEDQGAGGGAAFTQLEIENHRDEAGELTIAMFGCTKPVIAAINGAAVGMGATILLPADVRLLSDTGKIGYVFVRRGITPDGASTWFLPRIVGISKAVEWLVTGRVFGPDEALAAGLVNSVHAAEDLLPAAYAVAREIAENTAPVSVALTRQMVWRMLGESHPRTAHEVESRVLGFVGAAPDVAEGVASFLEKRAPIFPGRVSTDLPDFYPWWTDQDFTPLPSCRQT